jgi:hypothetical protein
MSHNQSFFTSMFFLEYLPNLWLIRHTGPYEPVKGKVPDRWAFAMQAAHCGSSPILRYAGPVDPWRAYP